MKAGTLDLMKFKRLKRMLGESERGTAGLLECLWQRAWRDCPRGDIGRLTNDEIAVIADWQGDADILVAALVETGWLDVSDEHRLLIHDWHEHAPYWLKGVVARKGGFATIVAEPSSPTMLPTIEANYQAKPSQVLPSQSSPSPVLNPSAPDPEPLSAAWVEVVGVLKKEGMGGAEQVCETCRDNGCGVHEATRVIEHWQKNKPRWGVGLLYKRLEFMRPGERHLRGWPDDGGTVGYEQVTADEFREFGRLRQFKKAPDRNKSSPTWVFGELRDGRKVECRDYPLPEKTSPPLEATRGPE